jgi:rSAM/selenodomain-associated transferase 1
MQKGALIIFAKVPDKNNVKTRLAGHLTDDERLKLYTKLLNDTIWKLRCIPDIKTYICYTPESAEGYFNRSRLDVFPQTNGDIGKRMFEAIQHLLAKGYERVLLVGVDIPGLADSIITDAMNMLAVNDVVFGPAKDGGYYLVGIRKPIEELFEDIEWSTKDTLKQSIRIAESLGLTVAFTEVLSDIDTIDDVKRVESLFKNVLS